MRRRAFRPALESLDFRISPSNLTGSNIVLLRSPAVLPPDTDDADDANPLWNEPSTPGGYPPPDDENPLWCPSTI